MIEKYSKLLEKGNRKTKVRQTARVTLRTDTLLMALGGKRLRPMLTLLAYSLYKKNVKDIMPYAVAVEAFHNFTLMHDDIMDKAPLRRGHPTVHQKWNVNTAILSGDVMLVKVYDMFLSIHPNILEKVIRRFNKCAFRSL
jgi:geranylgeranyl diphosphate synthase type II